MPRSTLVKVLRNQLLQGISMENSGSDDFYIHKIVRKSVPLLIDKTR